MFKALGFKEVGDMTPAHGSKDSCGSKKRNEQVHLGLVSLGDIIKGWWAKEMVLAALEQELGSVLSPHMAPTTTSVLASGGIGGFCGLLCVCIAHKLRGAHIPRALNYVHCVTPQ